MSRANKRNLTAYQSILENNPNGADLFEVDSAIAEVDNFLNNANVHPTMKTLLANSKAKLQTCRDDLAAGRQNGYWERQKVRVQKGIDEVAAEEAAIAEARL